MELVGLSMPSSLAAIFVGILAFVSAYLFLFIKRGSRNTPPGPMRIPFIGTLLFHGFKPEDFTKLGETYGNIFTVYVGNVRCVVLNSYDLMKQALVSKSNEFSGRGDGYVLQKTNPHKLGIVDAEYTTEMRRHRNNALSTFRTLGFGKPVMESKIQEEAEILARAIQARNGEAYDLGALLTISVTNVINSVLYNTRYEHNDKSFSEVIEYCDNLVKSGAQVFILDFFPWLCWIPSMKRGLDKFMKAHHGIMDFARKGINEHYESHTSGLNTDFVHTLIEDQLNSRKNESNLDKDNIHFMMRDFFVAGMETTATSMKWLLLLMANRLEIQDKAHEEIDRVVGKDRPVRISDKDQLHYVQAIIWEVQRFKTIVPLSVPHYTETDATLGGYDIPAGTQIIQNLTHVHMNPATWKDPHVFRPERFINNKGCYERHSHLIPFSMGKRQCLGEVLARQELFLFAASLLQKFTFHPPEGVRKLDEEGIFGFTFSPKPFEIRAILR